MRTGDIVPTFGLRNEYVVRIDRVYNSAGATVGWVYVGNRGDKVVEGTKLMSTADLRKARITLWAKAMRPVSSFPRFRSNPWADLKIEPCPPSEMSSR